MTSTRRDLDYLEHILLAIENIMIKTVSRASFRMK